MKGPITKKGNNRDYTSHIPILLKITIKYHMALRLGTSYIFTVSLRGILHEEDKDQNCLKHRATRIGVVNAMKGREEQPRELWCGIERRRSYGQTK